MKRIIPLSQTIHNILVTGVVIYLGALVIQHEVMREHDAKLAEFKEECLSNGGHIDRVTRNIGTVTPFNDTVSVSCVNPKYEILKEIE